MVYQLNYGKHCEMKRNEFRVIQIESLSIFQIEVCLFSLEHNYSYLFYDELVSIDVWIASHYHQIAFYETYGEM